MSYRSVVKKRIKKFYLQLLVDHCFYAPLLSRHRLQRTTKEQNSAKSSLRMQGLSRVMKLLRQLGCCKEAIKMPSKS